MDTLAPQVIEGSAAVALAVQACRPEVVSAYPISPQTHIVEGLARMVAKGQLNSEYVRVESEFAAISVLAGASAAGSRTYTASSSQGLLYMTEALFATAGMRLPIVMTAVNRSVSAPISIMVDQRDTMTLRDSGIIQLYAESSQEAYDMHIAAFRIAESEGIWLPVFVCMDGWVLTHSYEQISPLSQEQVDAFLPPFHPPYRLDPARPLTFGSYAEAEYQMEMNFGVQKAQLLALRRIGEVFAELETYTGRHYGSLVETFRCEDAEIILVGMGSVCGTIKDAIDELRAEGKKVGLLRIRCYRPFPREDILRATGGARIVTVVESTFSMGAEGCISLDLKAGYANAERRPLILDIIGGLGGREVSIETVSRMVAVSERALAEKTVPNEAVWFDLDASIVD